MNSSSLDAGREAGMFDALLALSRRLRLLVLGPLIVASLVVGALLALPSSFHSQAIIVLPLPKPTVTEIGTLSASVPATALGLAQAASVMKSPMVLDKVFLAMNPGSGTPDDKKRNALAARIQASPTKDGLLKIDVTAASALEAQKTADLLIDAWLVTTKPAPKQQAELENRLAHARENLRKTQAILASQKSSFLSVAGLGELLDRFFYQSLEIERQLSGLNRDVVLQSPTLASGPVSQPYATVFLLVAFGVELLMIIWILGWHALESARQNPETAQRMEKLRGAVSNFSSRKNAESDVLNRVDGA